jgi:hypothetical protein
MAVCEILPSCIFFNEKMQNMPGTTAFFKVKYCQGDNTNCARFKVLKSCGRENVPADLFPNQVEKANNIIALFKK